MEERKDGMQMSRGQLDELFMGMALDQARQAAEVGEVPIGAVVVHEGVVIARAHNRRELDDDPSAHAEFSAMVEAARVLGRWRLTGCTVYVTLEPCTMCAGLMVNARVDRCVYGARDPKGGALGSLYRLNDDARLNHRFAVTAGVRADECASMLRSFFTGLRAESGGAALSDATLDAHAASCSCDAFLTESDRLTAEQGGAPAPRVLLAIDSFKGSATSAQVEEWVAEGVRRAAPMARVTRLPVADGGEGTVDAVREARGGELVGATVRNPFGARVGARYLLMPNGRALIESASAAGIGFSRCTHEDALCASTYGVGELVSDAVERGARTVYVCLGGSATNDGGAGFLRALGAWITDAAGEEIESGLAGLRAVDRVDLSEVFGLLAGVKLVALTDVRSPLVGRRGAVQVFGGQKGLGSDAMDECDRWMVRYARALDAARSERPNAEEAKGRAFRNVAGVPGAGAAGGLGAALLACGAELVSGADAVLDLIGFDEALRMSDLVVTGEGMVDGQTAEGKLPCAVARRARAARVPVVAVAGGRADNLDAVYRAGIDAVVAGPRVPMPLEEAMEPDAARMNLVAAGETVMRTFLL